MDRMTWAEHKAWLEGTCEAVIRRLEEHSRDIHELKELLRGKTQLTRDERAKARATMSALQKRLKHDFKRGLTEEKRAAMDCYEQEYLHPTVGWALSSLRFRSSSHPVRCRWFESLADAENAVDGYLELLKMHLESMVIEWSEYVIPPEGFAGP